MRRTSVRTIHAKNRRRDRRIELPTLVAELDGSYYTTADWSLGGFRLADYDGVLSEGDHFRVRLFGSIGEEEVQVSVTAQVVRRDSASKQLAAFFCQFDEESWDALEQLTIQRMRRARTAS